MIQSFLSRIGSFVFVSALTALLLCVAVGYPEGGGDTSSSTAELDANKLKAEYKAEAEKEVTEANAEEALSELETEIDTDKEEP